MQSLLFSILSNAVGFLVSLFYRKIKLTFHMNRDIFQTAELLPSLEPIQADKSCRIQKRGGLGFWVLLMIRRNLFSLFHSLLFSLFSSLRRYFYVSPFDMHLSLYLIEFFLFSFNCWKMHICARVFQEKCCKNSIGIGSYLLIHKGGSSGGTKEFRASL